MSYSIEDLKNCRKKIVFNFEKVNFASQIGSQLEKKRKTVALKGFRVGKAPMTMVEKFFRGEVEEEVVRTFVLDSLNEAIRKEDLRVVGTPTFSQLNHEKESEALSFEVMVETFPQFEVCDFKGWEFEKESVAVKDEDITALKDNYRRNKATFVDIEDKKHKLAKGDHCVMDYEGTRADGSKPDSMRAQDASLEIGGGRFIPGFEEGMVGMKVGEKREIKVTFPADYHAEDLRNENVVFAVELKKIQKSEMPEFDAAFAKELGHDSVEDFETKSRENIAKYKAQNSEQKLHTTILERLVEQTPFEVPASLVEMQKESLREDVKSNLKRQGMPEEGMPAYFERWEADITQRAEFQVRSSLIFEKLARQLNVVVVESDMTVKMKEMADSMGLTLEQVQSFYSSNEAGNNAMMYAIKEEKVFEQLKKSMKIVEK